MEADETTVTVAAVTLSLPLTTGDDTATLDLNAIIDDGAGGVDTITLNAVGQLVEVVGSDLMIGRFPAVRLDGFTRVTISDASVPGDYNSDGRVDAADYSLWRDSLGQPAGTLANNVDGGAIGEGQFDTWRSNYGVVSEPQTVALPPAQASSGQLSVDPAARVPERQDSLRYGSRPLKQINRRSRGRSYQQPLRPTSMTPCS